MKSIDICSFKNFRHLHIDNLGAINLIVGKNNTGKSTLLEAISILASGGNIDWLKKILEIRGWNCMFENSENADVETLGLGALCSLSHGRDFNLFKKHPILLKAEGTKSLCEVEIRIVDLISVVETDGNGVEFKKLILKDKVSDDGTEVGRQSSLGVCVSFNGSKAIYTLENFFTRRGISADKSIPFEFVKTAEFTGDKNPLLYDKIALSPLENVLIDALKIIDPHITAINFLYDATRSNLRARRTSDVRVPFVVCDGMEGKYRLSSMGDGINRILTIVLSMLNCKDGVLLIDEFENGLHYSVQTDLWRLICRLSRELNIQVFATTHSQDCIKSFLKATDDISEEVRLIRLETREHSDVAVVYEDKDEFDYISNNDIETR